MGHLPLLEHVTVMVALPFASAVLKVAVRGTIQGTGWVNTFHVKYTGTAPSAADLTTFANALAPIYKNRLMTGTQSTGSTMVGIDVTDLSAETSPKVTTTQSQAGNVAGTALPAGSSIVISWNIQRRYRGGHPRTYVPGLTITSLNSSNSSQVSAAQISTLGAGASGFISDVAALTVGTASCKLVCLSYYQGRALRGTPQTFDITGAAVHSRMDSQRRRLGKES